MEKSYRSDKMGTRSRDDNFWEKLGRRWGGSSPCSILQWQPFWRRDFTFERFHASIGLTKFHHPDSHSRGFDRTNIGLCPIGVLNLSLSLYSSSPLTTRVICKSTLRFDQSRRWSPVASRIQPAPLSRNDKSHSLPDISLIIVHVIKNWRWKILEVVWNIFTKGGL